MVTIVWIWFFNKYFSRKLTDVFLQNNFMSGNTKLPLKKNNILSKKDCFLPVEIFPLLKRFNLLLFLKRDENSNIGCLIILIFLSTSCDKEESRIG